MSTLNGLRVSEITRYPVKSLGGETLDTVEVGLLGPAWDRRWMVVDREGVYLSQRSEPRLALARSSIAPGQLVIETDAQETLHLPLEPDRGETLRARVWSDTVEAIAMSGAASEWFSDFLHRRCELVYLPEARGRALSPDYGQASDRTSLTDGYPFLIIGQASLDHLNARLETPVPMNRFRPNLVIEGADPFAEDHWTHIRVGDLPFRVVKPCARCVVTTTDQSSAERSPEPLKTLATFRSFDGKIMFGMNAIHDGSGRIDVGAQIDIVKRRA